MKRIQKQALAHYDRMIEWVEKQNPRSRVDMFVMLDEISEGWTDDYCSYCKKMGVYDYCEGCELHTPGHGHCCNGLWFKMNYSATWKTWLKYAKLVREYIRENG